MHQVVELTYEQKVKMYQEVDKEELIKMLIQANQVIASLTSNKN